MNNYISTITSISTDTLILVGLVALFVFIGLKVGRGYLISLLVSIYVAAFLYANVFFVGKLVFVETNSLSYFLNHLAIFMLFLVPINLLVNKLISSNFDRGASKFLKILLLALGCAGLTLAIFYHLLPLDSAYDFSAGVDKLFSSNLSFTAWLLIPLIILFF